MYPVLNLKHFQPDLHWYLRALEEVVIRGETVIRHPAGNHRRVAQKTGDK